MRNKDNYSMSHSSLMHCTFFPETSALKHDLPIFWQNAVAKKLMLFVLPAKHFISPRGLRQPGDNIVLHS